MYEQIATVTVRTDDRSPTQVAAAIAAALQEAAGA
jgi:hypothetical protein